MSTRADRVERVDAFMAGRKRILSVNVQNRWEPSHKPDEVIMKWPLECEGELLPGALFAINSLASMTLKVSLATNGHLMRF